MYTRSISNRNEDPLELGNHKPTASSGIPVDLDPLSYSERSIFSHNIGSSKHSKSHDTKYGLK